MVRTCSIGIAKPTPMFPDSPSTPPPVVAIAELTPTTWPRSRAGYRVAAWTRGVFDTAEPGAAAIARRARRGRSSRATILLLHDADGWAPERPRQQTADALPEICRAARERGLGLVTLDELVGPA